METGVSKVMESEQKSQWIIVACGHEYYGPFDSREEAVEYRKTMTDYRPSEIRYVTLYK